MTNRHTTENLINLLAHALPLVEDAITDPCYSASGQKAIERLAREIQETVESYYQSLTLKGHEFLIRELKEKLQNDPNFLIDMLTGNAGFDRERAHELAQTLEIE